MSAERPRSQLPTLPRAIVDRYLQAADAALPDRVTALYLVGSLALDDYRQDSSDVDFVTVTRDPLTEEELAQVEAIHSIIDAAWTTPRFSGIYATPQDLTRDPTAQPLPNHLEGVFQRSGAFDANPAICLTLERHPLVIRGQEPTVWSDPAVMRTWARGNLLGYWSDAARRLAGLDLSHVSTAELNGYVGWCVPGVLRLAYTIETDDVTSKSGACRFGLSWLAPRWHPIIEDALAVRSSGRSPAGAAGKRRDATVALMEHATERVARID